jgi:hypothetical protein
MGAIIRTGGIQLGLEQNRWGRGGDLFEPADSGFLCAAAAAAAARTVGALLL